MPQKVPLYVCVRPFQSYGSKMPAYPMIMRSDMKQCKVCDEWIWSSKDENWFRADCYCDECIVEVRKANPPVQYPMLPAHYSHGVRIYNPTSETVYTEPEVPRGNLPEEQYRFWIGYEDYGRTAASCRACGELVVGGPNRDRHCDYAKEKHFYKGDMSCMYVLTQAYKKLLVTRMCMVCKEGTMGRQKWGVPLCSPKCIKEWKFDARVEKYPRLDMLLADWWNIVPPEPIKVQIISGESE